MLKGISPILSPQLLKVLCEMGHSDTIVIADGNFPAETMGKNGIVIRMDGHGRTLMKLTMNSGRLVPKATTVSPITNSLTRNLRARPHAPSVKRSAPHKTTIKPSKISRILSTISYKMCANIQHFQRSRSRKDDFFS